MVVQASDAAAVCEDAGRNVSPDRRLTSENPGGERRMNIAVDRSLGKSNAKHHVVRPDHEVVIIGAGISGIGAAIQLQGEGIEDFLILERSSGVGGTWRHNRYPGIAVDITSFTYSYSFEQNPNWSRFFAPGCELQNYVERVAAKYRIYEKARFNVAVTNATFDDISHVWTIEDRKAG